MNAVRYWYGIAAACLLALPAAPGANGSILARAASEAAPDGYTLFMPALSSFVALPSVAPNLPITLPRDFLPIGYAAENPMFFAVSRSLGVSTLPQLIALVAE